MHIDGACTTGKNSITCRLCEKLACVIPTVTLCEQSVLAYNTNRILSDYLSITNATVFVKGLILIIILELTKE